MNINIQDFKEMNFIFCDSEHTSFRAQVYGDIEFNPGNEYAQIENDLDQVDNDIQEIMEIINSLSVN